MKHLFFLFSAIALLFSASATEALILQKTALPGSSRLPVSGNLEKGNLSPEFRSAGTAAFWVRPDGWDQQETAWHFFLAAGKIGKDTPHIYLYRFPDGRTRLLWSLNSGKKQAGELLMQAPFRKGGWTHLAFTWKAENGHTDLKLYLDGRLMKSRRVEFEFGGAFPMEWKFGDRPAWNPKSPHSTTIGRIELHPTVLDDAAVAALAAQKMKDGAITLINRKFIPGSVNQISGAVESDSVSGLVLEAVFADELGKTVTEKLDPRWERAGKQLRFHAELRLPDDTVETRLAVRSEKGASPVWKAEKIRYADWLPPVEPNYWKASWIWSGNVSEPEAHRYFVTHFDADPDQLAKVAFQGACDESAVLYLNGKEAVKIS